MPKKIKPSTQYQRFVDAARKLGTNESEDAFARTVRKVAKAPTRPKKSVKNTGKS